MFCLLPLPVDICTLLNIILNKFRFHFRKKNDALFYALTNNRFEVAKYLLSQGAVVDGEDLEEMIGRGNLKIIPFLQSQGVLATFL